MFQPFFKLLFCLSLLVISTSLQAQITNIGEPSSDSIAINFAEPKEYKLAAITYSGAKDFDQALIQNLSGLIIGEIYSIPGDKIAKAIEILWKQQLFTDITVTATKIEGNNVFLDIHFETLPRLAKFTFKGVKKGDADDLREKIKLTRGKIVNENLMMNIKNKTIDFYKDKGYLDITADIKQIPDTIQRNSVIIQIAVRKNKKIKINEIIIEGNALLSDGKIRRTLKETKRYRWWNVFNSAKYNEENFEKDKEKLIAKYNAKGYRDAKIEYDTVYRVSYNRLDIKLRVNEGNQYYFGNIAWFGNTKHPTKILDEIVGIKKGDKFNQDLLNSRLNMSQDGRDVSSLYMDDGYLFFQIQPTEVNIYGDTIDYEMRINEGRQARVNHVTIIGNTKTNDRVILREIRTKPGMLFSRADIIRTQRELAQLRYFNEQTLGVNPIPNQADGTVDIEYTVEEKSNDQIQLSGGYGANRLIGTLGLSLGNFSAKNMFKAKSWTPIPSGDGQTFSINGSTSGAYYSTLSASFTEPWLGGKKPNSFSTSIFWNIYNPTGITKKVAGDKFSQMATLGATIGLGKRLKIPDDYFQLYQDVSWQRYTLTNYAQNPQFTDGIANNISYGATLSRSSVDAAIFPTGGSTFKASVQVTPPYSLFRGAARNATLTSQEKYKWSEYHKWKFTAQWFTKIAGKFVLNTKAGLGVLGYYNDAIGQSPFERFRMGGSGLTGGFNLFGSEIIAMRGYHDGGLNKNGDPSGSGVAVVKYTAELRYPVVLSPQASVYALAFLDAGNNWFKLKDFAPFDVKRGTGMGIRALIPALGMIGLDYGWNLDAGPLDALNYNHKAAFKGLDGLIGKGQFHFTLGANIGDL
ncbi:MAG: outer membrane protein assembly factor BamA [Bacteroidia bacterium]|nr:outer membrane protein assembly factor BamA [Bacteroidia bacterium]